jgi:hypothetical protein
MLFPDPDVWTLLRELDLGALCILAFMGCLVVWYRRHPERATIVYSIRRVRRFW